MAYIYLYIKRSFQGSVKMTFFRPRISLSTKSKTPKAILWQDAFYVQPLCYSYPIAKNLAPEPIQCMPNRYPTTRIPNSSSPLHCTPSKKLDHFVVYCINRTVYDYLTSTFPKNLFRSLDGWGGRESHSLNA